MAADAGARRVLPGDIVHCVSLLVPLVERRRDACRTLEAWSYYDGIALGLRCAGRMAERLRHECAPVPDAAAVVREEGTEWR